MKHYSLLLFLIWALHQVAVADDNLPIGEFSRNNLEGWQATTRNHASKPPNLCWRD